MWLEQLIPSMVQDCFHTLIGALAELAYQVVMLRVPPIWRCNNEWLGACRLVASHQRQAQDLASVAWLEVILHVSPWRGFSESSSKHFSRVPHAQYQQPEALHDCYQ